MVDPSAAQRAIAKIETAAGSAAANVPLSSDHDGTDTEEGPVPATVRSALRHRHALELTYYSASRDVLTERTVDPIRTVVVDDNSYVQA
ncbi:WYL domain-containing protein, partial [Klebsiella pneumoniae]|nr:WYL domain-containing protein [Klebsiella pneumoniae]